MYISLRVPLKAILMVLALLIGLAPIIAWSGEPGLQHLRSSNTRQDGVALQEESTRGASLTSKDLGATPAGVEGDWTDGVDRRWLDDNVVERETRKTIEELESKRRYLNRLSEASLAATGDQVADIAFVKTHKTGSTTLAAIMYRYALRHNLELSHFFKATSVSLEKAVAQTKESNRPVDVMHYHISPEGQYSGNWNDTVKHYQGIMRNPDRINYVTLLREPRSHLLSYYYYYLQPYYKQSIQEFLMNPNNEQDYRYKRLINPLSAEFGIRTSEEMQSFIKDAIPDFKLIIITERMDEGILVLRHMLGWHMIDVTYCDLNETKAGSRRWDGKPLVTRPHFDELPVEVQEKIDELTNLDRVLYGAGVLEFEKQFAPYADLLKEENTEFQELQNVINEYLAGNSSSMAKTMFQNMDIVYKENPQYYPF